MRTTLRKCFTAIFVFCFAGSVLLGGCARYAKYVEIIYEPVVKVGAQGSSVEVHISIPAKQISSMEQVKWELGAVTDGEGWVIDSLYSPSSPADLVRSALTQEMRQSGYSIFSTTTGPIKIQKLIDITKAEITLDQISDFSDIKATCKIVLGMDVYKNGQLSRKLEYMASSTRTVVTDRDLLARKLLQENLHTVMKNAVPDLIKVLEK